MAVTVWKGLPQALRAAGTVAVKVTAPAESARLEEAVRKAAADIEEIGFWETEPDPEDPESGDWECAEVTGPIPVPGGFLLMIHAGNTPREMNISDIPGIFAGRLAEAGINDARVRRAEEIGQRYRVLDSFTPVARALMRGPGDRHDALARPHLVAGLIHIAQQWLRLELGRRTGFRRR